jgi:hypoxanthine-guanine phosphoribosyltransferase
MILTMLLELSFLVYNIEEHFFVGIGVDIAQISILQA